MEKKLNANNDLHYNKGTWLELLLYPFGMTTANVFMFLMMMVSYFATGVVGIATVLISVILTGTRLFDGFVDPFIGLVIDKTKGKFGKILLFYLIGYGIMTVMTLIIFFLVPKLPENLKVIAFIVLYLVYIIGYSLVNTIFRVGLSIISNHPKQRPLLGGIEIVYNIVFFALASMYLSKYLAVKYKGLTNPGLFKEWTITTIIIGGIFLLLSIIAIWKKDKMENFSSEDDEKTTIRDMWEVVKDNRALQVMVSVSAVNKLALQTASNSILSVVVFGVILGNYGMSGSLTSLSTIPNILIVFFGIRYATKFGTKKGFNFVSIMGAIATSGIIAVLLIVDGKSISLDNLNIQTIIFVGMYLLINASRYLSSGLISPMLPDVTDYEHFRTGRFVPGIISTTYSLVDNIASSLSTTIVGMVMALIGFKEALPDLTTPLTNDLLYAGVFLAYGVLLIGFILGIVLMRFYPLDNEYMKEIQTELSRRQQEV